MCSSAIRSTSRSRRWPSSTGRRTAKPWRARSATEPAKDRSGWKSSSTGTTRAMLLEQPRGTGRGRRRGECASIALFQRNEIGESADPLAADRALTTSFWLVFVAEWEDATQIGTAALVARFPEHRWQVLSGATLGLWVGALLAVAIGRAAGHWLPEVAMRRVAGAVFCTFAIFTAVHGY